MAGFEVRKAERGDIPAVLSLLRELAEYEHLLDHVAIDERLLAEHAFGENACAEMLLGFLDGVPVSYAIFFPHFASFEGVPWLYLEDLYVQPHARGSGAGRSMMIHLGRIALERRWAGLFWGVLDWNEAAFAFYQKLGAARITGVAHMELSGEALERLVGNP